MQKNQEEISWWTDLYLYAPLCKVVVTTTWKREPRVERATARGGERWEAAGCQGEEARAGHALGFFLPICQPHDRRTLTTLGVTAAVRGTLRKMRLLWMAYARASCVTRPVRC